MNEKVKSKKQGSVNLNESLRISKKPQKIKKQTALVQENEELTILNRLAQKVTSQLSLQKACNVAVKELSLALGLDVAVLFIQEGDELRLKAIDPASSYIQPESIKLHIVGECLCGLAALTGRPVFSNDIHKDKRCTWTECKKAGLCSFAAIPLRSGNKPVGILGIASAVERDFKESSHFLKAAANQLAISIHNARQFEKIQGNSLELQQQIAERKQAEGALQKSEEKLQSIFRVAPTGIGVVKDRILLDVNPRVCKMTGYEKEELVGKSARIFYPTQEDFEYVGTEKYRQIAERGTGVVETRWMKKDGTIFDVLLASTPIDLNDLSKGVTFTALDISERKRAEETIRREKQFTETLLESLPGLFYPYDFDIQYPANSRLIKFNRKHSTLTGYTPKELQGMKIKDWFEPDVLEEAVRAISIISERGEAQANLRLRMKDGSQVPYSFTGQLLNIYDKMYFLGMGIDISDFIRAQEDVKDSEEKYHSVMSNASDAILLADMKGNLLEVNRKAEELLGYTKEELTTMNFTMIHPQEELERTSTAFYEIILKGFTYLRDGFVLRKDGEMVPVDITGSLIAYADKLVVQGIFRDITERRLAEQEKRKIEGQLVQAQKMESIGQLAGGIAHDFNNLLTAILGYGHLLKNEASKDERISAYVGQILSAAERAAILTNDLLTFSRKQIINPQPVNLNKIIKNMESLLLRVIGEDIELSTVLTDADLIIMADSTQIDQILMNLATNAQDAMPKGGRFIISTDCMELNGEYIRAYGYGNPGYYALLSVEDTGIGIDDKTRERIFEPFFTTKEVGKGTGLGLSMVYGIVKQHDGYINVYSEPGRGTTLKILLPLVQSRVEELKPNDLIKAKGGTETILIGEDDRQVRSLLKEVLSHAGYNIMEAVDGDDAIKVFHKDKDNIHLLILDVIMPKKNGKEVYSEIKKVKSDMKVIFVSGYSADIIHKKGILEIGVNFISKPVSPDKLLIKVRDVLDK